MSSDSTMRITGIASGLGTDSIIAVLVAARKQPIDTLQTKVNNEEIQLSAYTQIQTLANTLDDAANALSQSSLWNSKTATSSNTSVVTATATSSASGTYKVHVGTQASAEIVRGTSQTASTTYSTDADSTISINGTSITISKGSSLSDISSAINTASSSMATGSKVKSYIINNTLVIEKQDTGATADSSGTANSNAITFTDDSTSGILKTLGVLDSSGSVKDKTDGTDLSGTINGVSFTNSSNTLSSQISGVTVSIAGEGDSTISISNDTSKIEDAVNTFLTAYNGVYDYIKQNTAVTTTSAGEALSAGILQGQFYPSSLEDKLFGFMSSYLNNSGVSSSFNNLTKIGITRDDTSGDYSISDTSKFTAALTSNLSDVKNIFMGSNSSGYYGIAKQIDTYISTNVVNKLSGTLSNIIDQTNNEITDNNSKISDLTSQLDAYQTNLYDHYASMESMVQNWNSSLKYLLSSLGTSS